MLGLVVVQGRFGIYHFAFLGVLLAVAVAAGLLCERSRRTLRGAVAAAAACVLARVVLLPTLLPYWRDHRERGVERSPAEVALWGAQPSDYLAVRPSHLLYDGVLWTQFYCHMEHDVFPCAAVLVLATPSFAERHAGWARWALLGVVAVPVALSFGLAVHVVGRELPSSYRLLYDAVPCFKAIRVPVRFGLLATVGLAGLAGLGATGVPVPQQGGRSRLPSPR